MVAENRLDGAFQTAKGQSNSANNGYLPAARALAKEIKEPSKEHYTSLTEDFWGGAFWTFNCYYVKRFRENNRSSL